MKREKVVVKLPTPKPPSYKPSKPTYYRPVVDTPRPAPTPAPPVYIPKPTPKPKP